MRALSKSKPTQCESTLKKWANTVWEHSQKVSQHSVRALSKSELTQCESTLKSVWPECGQGRGSDGGWEGDMIEWLYMYVCIWIHTWIPCLYIINTYILVYSESSRHLTAPYLYSFLSSPCSIDPHGFSVFTHFLYFVTPAFSTSKLSSPSFLPDFQALFVLLPWNFYQ